MKMTRETTDKNVFFSLSILLFQENSIWVAQCLEKDIVAQGDSVSDVVKAFKHTLIGQIILDTQDKKEPLVDITSAPAMYWGMFKEAKMYEASRPLEFPKGILPAWIIGATSELRLSA